MCFFAWRDSVREEKHNREVRWRSRTQALHHVADTNFGGWCACRQVIAKFAFRMKYNGVMRAFDRWQSKCVPCIPQATGGGGTGTL